MDNFIIQIIFKFRDIPNITTYYEFNINQLDIFESWYNTFDDYYINDMLITRDNIIYKLIESKEDMILISNFLKNFDNPFNLLEQIDELDEIFMEIDININETNDNESLSSDSNNETETINEVINAHITGDIKKVKEILLTLNDCDDDVINDIKKKYD